MAVSSNVYQAAIDQALQGNWSWGTTCKMGLLTSAYTPNLSTHVHWSDVSANETTGTGYVAGGAALATPTHAETAAASWATAWAATTAYAAGTIIRPVTAPSPDGLFVAVSTSGTGTSGASEPTWPAAAGNTVTDNAGANQIIWSNLGQSITVYSSANFQWTSATFSAAYGVIYYNTGTASTSPLICLVNFGGTLSPSSGTLTVSPSATNGWFFSCPS